MKMFRVTVLLASISLAISTDLFRNHLEKYVDHNVRPCDNFYRFVCSSEMPKKENIMERTEQTARTWTHLGERITKERYPITAFEKTMKEVADDEILYNQLKFVVMHLRGTKLDALEDTLFFYVQLSKYKDFLAYRGDRTKFAHHDLVEKMLLATKLEIEGSEHYPAAYKAVLRKKLEDIRYMTERENAITWEQIEELFQKADTIWTTVANPTNLPVTQVLIKAFERSAPLSQLLATVTNEFVTLELTFLQSFNAANVRGHIHVFDTFWMAGANASETAMLAAFGSAVGHEIFHSFQNTKFWDEDEYLKKSGQCITKHFQAVCDTYKEKGDCYSGPRTFAEDGSDVEGLQLAYKVFKQNMGDQLQKPFANSTLTTDQSFFVHAAMPECYPVGAADQDDRDTHSAGYTRVNARFSLMHAFHKAFECKKGDKMFDLGVNKEDCNTFGAPVRRYNNRMKKASGRVF